LVPALRHWARVATVPKQVGFGQPLTCPHASNPQSVTMDSCYIVPVEPASGGGEIVVIQVRQNGPRPLDVQLVGCEGESPYVVNCKMISKLPSFPVLTQLSSATSQYRETEAQVQGYGQGVGSDIVLFPGTQITRGR
jgi:hypothetical protein